MTDMTRAVVALPLMVLMTSWWLARGEQTLTLLHTNDLHARYEQFDARGSPCSRSQRRAGKCFGGYARLVTAVGEKRRQYPNSLLLDAGDQYQGTLWFYKYGGQVTSHFMNWIGYDAMALGNHEFDRDIDGLLPFLQFLNFSVISANINATLEPDVSSYVTKSVILSVGGYWVGVIGYTTQDTPALSSPGDLQFDDVVASVQAEAERLSAEGIDKIIALGHAGYTVDKEVALIRHVDLVIGGHSNTFLYTGAKPSVEEPEGAYPTEVPRSDGSRGLVVQDYAYGKYLGVLHLTFDDSGDVISYCGNPVLLDRSVNEDQLTLEEMVPWARGVSDMIHTVVGRSLVKLQGDRGVCRQAECNLASLVADAFVHQNLRYADEAEWDDVIMAFINGGGIRASIGRGEITVENVISVLPFMNTMEVIQLKGEHVRAVMERSASLLDPCQTTDLHGGFMHVSGMTVKLDMGRPAGQRVVSLHVLCVTCSVARYVQLDDNALYKVITSSYIASGGDGYTMFRDHAIERQKIEMDYLPARRRKVIQRFNGYKFAGYLDTDILVEYIKRTSPIIQGLEQRIHYVNNSNVCDSQS